MNIDGVSTGIVLDHINAGRSMIIYRLLGFLDGLSDLGIVYGWDDYMDAYCKRQIF